jgi:small subunit ribosomal protein S3
MDAQLVAENIASQLEKRISFRRAMKQAMSRTMKLGAKGIKTAVAGRLGGAEIARSEHYHEGTIPLQTLRADIDYGFAEANTRTDKYPSADAAIISSTKKMKNPISSPN